MFSPKISQVIILMWESFDMRNVTEILERFKRGILPLKMFKALFNNVTSLTNIKCMVLDATSVSAMVRRKSFSAFKKQNLY